VHSLLPDPSALAADQWGSLMAPRNILGSPPRALSGVPGLAGRMPTENQLERIWELYRASRERSGARGDRGFFSDRTWTWAWRTVMP
jgi:hypothetical protein